MKRRREGNIRANVLLQFLNSTEFPLLVLLSSVLVLILTGFRNLTERLELKHTFLKNFTFGRFHSTKPGGALLKYSELLLAGNSGSSNSFLSRRQSFLNSL